MPDHSARWWTGPALMLGAVGAALLFIECAVELVLNHPGVLLGQPHLVAVARYYHRGRDWQVIQADPRCVRWDAELGYVLRPPGCTISDPANRIFVDEGRLLALPEVRFAAELEEAQRFRRRYFGKNLVTIATRIFTGPSDRAAAFQAIRRAPTTSSRRCAGTNRCSPARSSSS